MRVILGLIAALLCSPALAGTLYIDTGGSATNSCSRDTNLAALSGTGDATVAAAVVQLTIGTDLSGVDATAGSPTQDTIYLAQATNSNTKVFWIIAKDDGLDQVTVSVAPTGVTGSNWAIGGRCILTNASQEAALRAGDTLIFNNSPAGQSATLWTFRNAGDTTSGYAKIMGKSGVRPVLNATSTNAAIVGNNLATLWIENLEIDQDGATGSGISGGNGANLVVLNVKIVDAGSGGGIILAGGNSLVTASEITGSAGDGVSVSSTASGVTILGNYIHDNTGDGIEFSGGNGLGFSVMNNVIDTNAARGIFLSAAPTVVILGTIYGNTIYANGNTGLEVVDIDYRVILTNDIFVSNGDAAGEYNVEWTVGAAETVGVHGYNDFYQGGGSAGNLSGLTATATEITTDPLLTNPASGNFTLGAGSPAKAIAYPGQLLGATGLGYLDLGAQQSQGSGGGAHSLIIGGP